jgi:hypothetical protein
MTQPPRLPGLSSLLSTFHSVDLFWTGRHAPVQSAGVVQCYALLSLRSREAEATPMRIDPWIRFY